MKKKDIQEDIERDVIKIFKKMDKIFGPYFGKMCPEFEPDCIQCQVNLEYNNFKSKIWQNFVRK